MTKNVFIFTLLQIYVRGKKYDLRKGWWKNMIFNEITVYTVDPCLSKKDNKKPCCACAALPAKLIRSAWAGVWMVAAVSRESSV